MKATARGRRRLLETYLGWAQELFGPLVAGPTTRLLNFHNLSPYITPAVLYACIYLELPNNGGDVHNPRRIGPLEEADMSFYHYFRPIVIGVDACFGCFIRRYKNFTMLEFSMVMILQSQVTIKKTPVFIA